MGMVIDTVPQYLLLKASLLDYLKGQFPDYSNEIAVEVSSNDRKSVGRIDNGVGAQDCLSPHDPREVDCCTILRTPFFSLIDTSVF